jgi:dipeptidyl aminopeptidase/acylaminoacyl peptidase
VKQSPWFLLLFSGLSLFCFGQTTYQPAPEPIRRILSAPEPPKAYLSPDNSKMLLMERESLPPVAELAKPVLRLAGERINPRNNGPHDPFSYRNAVLVTLNGMRREALRFPAGARLLTPEWNGSGDRYALAVLFEDRAELWIGDAQGVKAVPNLKLNLALPDGFAWSADGKSVYARAVPANRGPVPTPPAAPTGPNVQQSSGRSSDTWTLQDMLASEYDEKLFEYYTTSQLVRVDAASTAVTAVGKPAQITTIDPAPDNTHVLVRSIHRPYSWLYAWPSFPLEIEVWNAAGAKVHTLASLPLADTVSMDGVRTGPRWVTWHPMEPAALVWVEALDGGNPKEKATNRDRILIAKAPFREPKELQLVQHRFSFGNSAMVFLKGGGYLYRENQRERRWTRTTFVSASGERRVVDDRASRDRYKDPGDPVLDKLPNGKDVLLQNQQWSFLKGDGASAEGEYPFLDRVNMQTGEKSRVFQSEKGTYETVEAVLNADGTRLLTRRESATEPPNYYLLDNGRRTAVTNYQDPAPEFRKVTKRLVTYQRTDGVPLSFTLYLPPGSEGKRLPTLVWAYPLEFNDASTAGQVSSTSNRFTAPRGASHLYMALAGYAILDNASLPIVGDLKVANDTFVEQIVAGAKAAIDKAVELGVTDPDRVGVAGHSYGGFMTANLLAHSDLFRAGVARSGAYNRTLTPFGFQGERRTFWEAQPIDSKMSPFMHANRIKEPILFIHGIADNNPGTFPIQSERMYQAVRGHGGITRLVMLPHESHGYRGRESVEHSIWEMLTWLDKHVKNAAPRVGASGGQN